MAQGVSRPDFEKVMRNLSFKEVMESDLFGTDVDELVSDLTHVCRARNGSGPTTEMMLARVAAEAIAEIKRRDAVKQLVSENPKEAPTI